MLALITSVRVDAKTTQNFKKVAKLLELLSHVQDQAISVTCITPMAKKPNIIRNQKSKACDAKSTFQCVIKFQIASLPICFHTYRFELEADSYLEGGGARIGTTWN